MVNRAFVPHELPSLMEAIFSSKDEGDIMHCLHGDDAQTFVDVIDEVRSTFVRISQSKVDTNTFCRSDTG